MSDKNRKTSWDYESHRFDGCDPDEEEKANAEERQEN